MLIATLQFSPELGKVESNIRRADELLADVEEDGGFGGLDILILPEMAFTGYNFPSLSAITPHLEPTTSGPSTAWATRTAQRLKCVVAVGYPEQTIPEPKPLLSVSRSNESPLVSRASDAAIELNEPLQVFEPSYYNSLVFVSAKGEIIAHYRKSFLYYTDENWASEGPAGFFAGHFPLPFLSTSDKRDQTVTNIAAGICMDINPHRFQAPWEAFEFANHCIKTHAKVVVLSMSWLSRLEAEEMETRKHEPDLNTVSYWIERFSPLYRVKFQEENESKMDRGPSRSGDILTDLEIDDAAEVIVIFANRAGEEGTAPLIGDVRYAGSSCVMGIKRPQKEGEVGEVRIWDILGRATEGVLLVNTADDAIYRLQTKTKPHTTEY